MAVILADAGVVAYNGYQFDGASHIEIKCEPVYDDAQRTVIYHRYRISVKSIVADAGGTGLDLATIRALLTKAGMALIVTNKGFYDLIVNNGNVNDVCFGPKPRIVSWTPIGSLYAAEIEWECETCIVYCGLPKYHEGVMAFNYDCTYSLDYRGLTVRAISGYVEIGMTRTGNTIPNTADNYRSMVGATIPDRFQRTSQSWKLSLDKRRCDFNVVDTELPNNNPWPKGVVKVDARHRVAWTHRGGQGGMLRNTISVDVEMAPDAPMLNAYAIFADIVKRRRDIATTEEGSDPITLLDEISAEENLFDRTASFFCGYRICRELKRLLADSGLWVPLNHNTWGEWAYSIEGVTGNRGYAGLRHLAASDSIIDPCSAVMQVPGDTAAPQATKAEKARNLLKNETPSPEKSWLYFQSHVIVRRDRAVVRHAILQKPEAEDADKTLQDVTGLIFPAVSRQADIMQRSGPSRYTAELFGEARRAGHKIPKPSLTKIGTANSVLKHDGFHQHLESNLLGVPVYHAKWLITYAVELEPGQVLPQPNFAEGVQADGTAGQPTGP